MDWLTWGDEEDWKEVGQIETILITHLFRDLCWQVACDSSDSKELLSRENWQELVTEKEVKESMLMTPTFLACASSWVVVPVI